MMLDGLLVLSGALSGAGVIGQAVTATGNTTSTNVIDLSMSGRDLGKGTPLEVSIEVVTAPAGGTSVQFQLIQADDATLSTNVQVLVQTDAIPVAVLTAGAQVPLHYDRADPYPARRYVALRYVLVGTFSAGSYFAAVGRTVADKQVNYGGGFAVL